MSRYWFARYSAAPKSFDLFWELTTWKLAGGAVPKPVTQAGRAVFYGTIALMAFGGVAAFVEGRYAPDGGLWAVAFVVWLLVCIGVSGLVMNMKTDPERSVEDYLLEASGKRIGD